MTTSDKHAVILGATGLVGSELLKRMLGESCYSKITLISRRQLNELNPKVNVEVLELSELAKSQALFTAEHVFCCLGTTIKTAGSQAAFRDVDLHGPLRAAQVATSSTRLEKFLVVSALGANAKSNVFYNKIKGEMELALLSLGIPELHIFRPSLLLGDRKKSRLIESIASAIAKPFSFIFKGPLVKYKPVEASLVAHAMLKAALAKNERGQFFHESDTFEEGH